MENNIIEQMKRVIEDHERRITKLELKAKASKIMRDPHLTKVIENLLKGVDEQRGRTGKY